MVRLTMIHFVLNFIHRKDQDSFLPTWIFKYSHPHLPESVVFTYTCVQVDIRCPLPLLLSSLFLEAESPSEPGTCCFSQTGQPSRLLDLLVCTPVVLGLQQMCITIPGFYGGAQQLLYPLSHLLSLDDTYFPFPVFPFLVKFQLLLLMEAYCLFFTVLSVVTAIAWQGNTILLLDYNGE